MNTFDRDNLEIIFNVLACTAVPLDREWAPIQFLKLRSGSYDVPLLQEADRSIDTAARAAGG